jgi:hypothetical protein
VIIRPPPSKKIKNSARRTPPHLQQIHAENGNKTTGATRGRHLRSFRDPSGNKDFPNGAFDCIGLQGGLSNGFRLTAWFLWGTAQGWLMCQEMGGGGAIVAGSHAPLSALHRLTELTLRRRMRFDVGARKAAPRPRAEANQPHGSGIAWRSMTGPFPGGVIGGRFLGPTTSAASSPDPLAEVRGDGSRFDITPVHGPEPKSHH